MVSGRNSDKLWRRLAASCVIAAVGIAPWSRWIALALAAFGVVAGVPHWFKRPWGDLLASSGLTPSRSDRTAVPPFPLQKETGSEKLQLRHRTVRRTPSEGSPGRITGASSKAESNREYSFDTWTFRTHSAKSSEPVLLPQNSIRLAADSAAAGPGQKRPPHSVDSKEVIDRSSILEDFEKRYRTKRVVSPIKEAVQPSRPSLAKHVDELHRRLAAEASARKNEEMQRGPLKGASPCDSDAFPTGLLIPAWSTDRKQKPARLAPQEHEPAVDPAFRGPQARTTGQVAKSPATILQTGPPPPALSAQTGSQTH